jgi:hypothetical protein
VKFPALSGDGKQVPCAREEVAANVEALACLGERLHPVAVNSGVDPMPGLAKHVGE